jgi:hypothetical protein
MYRSHLRFVQGLWILIRDYLKLPNPQLAGNQHEPNIRKTHADSH